MVTSVYTVPCRERKSKPTPATSSASLRTGGGSSNALKLALRPAFHEPVTKRVHRAARVTAPKAPDAKGSGTRCRYIRWAELMRLTINIEAEKLGLLQHISTRYP